MFAETVDGSGRLSVDTPKDTPALSALVSFTAIIIGYRNEATIVRAVESVMSQWETGLEVVVVTSGPNSGAALVRAKYPTVRVEEVTERLMPGGARNRGIEVATGDVLGFLAADCIALDGWVRGHRRAHGRGNVAVAAAIVNADRDTPWATASWLLSYSNRLPGYPSEIVNRSSARRHGLSVNRRLLAELGGYDPDIRIGEDTKMADSILSAGQSIWFDGSIRIGHRGPGGTIELLTDEFRRGRLVRAHRELHNLGVGRFSSFVVWTTMVRHSLLSGWRFGEISRLKVLASVPWIAAAAASQLLGARLRPRRKTK